MILNSDEVKEKSDTLSSIFTSQMMIFAVVAYYCIMLAALINLNRLYAKRWYH